MTAELHGVAAMRHGVTPHPHGDVQHVEIDFDYVDMRGMPARATGRVYLPEAFDDARPRRFPLVHVAGYELTRDLYLDDALQWVRSGYAVANPLMALDAWPHFHPVGRAQNLDLAWLHVARALPFVDDARVVVQGLSAGGHKALLLAAETFPLCGVIADVPPVNYAHNVAYWIRLGRLPKQPVPASLQPGDSWMITQPVTDIVETMVAAIGADLDAPPWFGLSPVAHVERITAPVSLLVSTADVLVPVAQIGEELERPVDAALFPPGFTTRAADLLSDARHRVSLLDALDRDDVEVRLHRVPAGTPTVAEHQADPARRALRIERMPSSRRWIVDAVDEGAPQPRSAHFTHAIDIERRPLLEAWTSQQLDPAQLTAAKLIVLMQRCSGVEWLAPQGRHLDDPAAERADVLRGLRTYVASSPAAAARFAELYARLDASLQALGGVDAAVRLVG